MPYFSLILHWDMAVSMMRHACYVFRLPGDQSHRITFLQVGERATPPGTTELQILNMKFAPTVHIVKT